MLGSECDFKMHVRNLGYPIPYKSRPKFIHFRRLRSLTANLTAYIFGTRHDVGLHNRASALETTKVYYIVSKCHKLWSTNDLKLDQSFYPPPADSALYFIARLRTLRSANETQPTFTTCRKVRQICKRTSKICGVPSPKNSGS